MRKHRSMYLKVGRPDVNPAQSSHVRGVRPGNRRGSLRREEGLRQAGDTALATARRSTGISPEAREPIDERMPTLTPP